MFTVNWWECKARRDGAERPHYLPNRALWVVHLRLALLGSSATARRRLTYGGPEQ